MKELLFVVSAFAFFTESFGYKINLNQENPSNSIYSTSRVLTWNKSDEYELLT